MLLAALVLEFALADDARRCSMIQSDLFDGRSKTAVETVRLTSDCMLLEGLLAMS